jgi:hypothetical protein
MLGLAGWFANKMYFFAQSNHREELDLACSGSHFGRFSGLELDFSVIKSAWGLASAGRTT